MKPIIPSDHDVFLFHEGSLFFSHDLFGSRMIDCESLQGVRFCVWAPHARSVSVVGNFNDWNAYTHPMDKVNDSGIWYTFVPELEEGAIYKYRIQGKDGRLLLKSDPYAFYSEHRPQTASIVQSLCPFRWTDQAWQRQKRKQAIYNRPVNIYEVHLGTWKRPGAEKFQSYRTLADELAQYAAEMGYTHIELLPLAEHPFDRSWGYQITGFFSVTSRYGTPQDFMYFVNKCHEFGIGVIMDWVPAHFCKDDHGLRRFDGSAVYEDEDERKAERPLWGTLSFDYGKPEVQSFLISNALFWLDAYHIDGLRVDAVASMIELNFDKPAEWHMTNQSGGTENLEALGFIKKLNKAVFERFPHALMIAEDSSAWPLVTAPVHIGGLGFNFKWNMGWMNDLLNYMELHPDDRKHHHNLITFSLMYAFSENFILAFSHDEVIHGKKSLLGKMPGDYWQKFANLRLLYGYLMSHPGKKLLFMGGEFAHFEEWKDLDQLDWMLLDFGPHRNMQRYVRDLNHFYLDEPALWENDFKHAGFDWIDANNAEQSIISFIRKGKDALESILIVCNFSAVVYHDYRIGVPSGGCYREAFNSDRSEYGGSNQINGHDIRAEAVPSHGFQHSIAITVPPLGVSYFKRYKKGEKV